MDMKKLSNKTLVRFISELQALKDLEIAKGMNVGYAKADKLYIEANEELNNRLQMEQAKKRIKSRNA